MRLKYRKQYRWYTLVIAIEQTWKMYSCIALLPLYEIANQCSLMNVIQSYFKGLTAVPLAPH